jgi:8-oxo-dGTP pyrophosphatase MutT (NUDIX family)
LARKEKNTTKRKLDGKAAVPVALTDATADEPVTTGADATKVKPADKSGDTSEPQPQYAALCWRKVRDKTEVLLVTSRDTGRWIIPKGWPIKGLAPHEAAAREAYEEAGAEGKVKPSCIGLYSYRKLLGPETSVPCVVAVYPIRTLRLLDQFPERQERRRKWFSPKKAATLVAEPELRELLRNFSADALAKVEQRAG